MGRLHMFIRLLIGAAAGVVVVSISSTLWELGISGKVAALAFAAGSGAVLAWLSARLHVRSITDGGTGLYNRRYLFERLNREWNYAKRSRGRLGLAVIDIDDFKQYNSRFGHLSGDRVLLAVAETLRANVRKGDIVGRWGGEEFAVILPGASLQEALAVAERLRCRIASLHLQLDGGEAAVTISAGIATVRTDDEEVYEFVRRADAAMFAAKQEKNRVLSC